jgi:DNA-binding GntR family transcriptional regulator
VGVASLQIVREEHSLRLSTVATLRHAILNLTFKPGQKLTERELCELTGVGRSLMREALRQIEAEGLIVNIPHKGPSVISLGLRDALEIYEVRLALEPVAARRFTEHASDAEIDGLVECSLNVRKASVAGDSDGITMSLAQFYALLYSGARNTLAAELARTLYNRSMLLRAVTFFRQTARDRKKSIAGHRTIVDLLARRDGDNAAAACAAHIRHSQGVAERWLREENSRSE